MGGAAVYSRMATQEASLKGCLSIFAFGAVFLGIGACGSDDCAEASFQCVQDGRVLEVCRSGEWQEFRVCEAEQECTAQGAAIGCVPAPEDLSE